MSKLVSAVSASQNESDHIRIKLSRSTGFTLDCDIDLPQEASVTVFFGPSGCGKTTILRAAAGLEKAPGFVRIAGQTWQDDEKGIFVPTYARRIGYVFQEASLFTHLNVIDNLRYGLKRIADQNAEDRLKEAVDLLGIGHLLTRRTNELSGGERQRCAIARSLAIRPSALFMDEPLSALDQARRREIMPWLERIKRELKVPILYVTHSEDEVMRLADQLVLMDQGKIVDVGPVAGVWLKRLQKEATATHQSSLMIGTVDEKDSQWSLMKIGCGSAHFWVKDSCAALGETVRVTVRSENVSVSVQKPSTTSIQNVFQAHLTHIRRDSDTSRVLLELDCDGSVIIAEVTARAVNELQLMETMPVWVQVKSVSIC